MNAHMKASGLQSFTRNGVARLAALTALTMLLAALFALEAKAGASIPGLQRWPTLPEQLQQARVVPGSALEQLIRDNQEFNLLDPGEMQDQLPYPGWLRINYRKAHPEFQYSATDPTHGYPHVLHEVYEWMVTHQDLMPGVTAKSSVEALEGDGSSLQVATIGTNRRVSGAQTTPRSESDIRIDYWNPNRIISASNAISAAGTQAVFYSADSGVTWGQTSLPLSGLNSEAFHSDPTVDWTSDGAGWSSTLGINSNGNRLYVRLYRSLNGGATWAYVATGNGTMRNADKQMHWVDHSATSPYVDRQYFIWHEGALAYMNTFSGGAFGTPIQVDKAETTGTPIGADVTSNANGDAFGAWPDTGSRGLYIVKSTNGGGAWTALGANPVPVATTYDSYDIGIPAMNSRRALIYVSIAAHRSGTVNNVYAAWTDLSGDTGCTAAANEPGTTVGSSCKTRVWFARSTDGGTTWSAPVRLNHQGSLNDQFNQDIVVDPTSGEIAVIYYDTVNDPGRLKTDVWLQRSCDGGATWTAAEKVTTAMTDETIAGADAGNQYGDYNSVSGYLGGFFPSWTDRRNGGKEEIWTAPIGSDIPAVPTGVAANVSGSAIAVSWNAVAGASSYKVYRSTGACPGGTYSLLQSGITATNYLDSTAAPGTTYSYVVVATGGSGPCDSAQSACASAAVPPCTPPGVPTQFALSTPALNTVRASWQQGTPAGATFKIYRAAGSSCSGATLLQGGITSLSYDDTTVTGGSTYSYQVSAVDSTGSCESVRSSCLTVVATGGPGVYSSGLFASGTPRDTSLGQDVRWIYNSGATALTPPASYSAVYSVSNDRRLHSMTFGVPGGDWPRTAPKDWKPPAMNGPAQGRAVILPVSLYPIGGATRVNFVSSQDGHVYCFNADTGVQLWMSPQVGDMVQSPPGMAFRQYGSAIVGKDLLFVGTRNSTSPNLIYALDASNGSVVWSFDNGGGSNAIGIITAMVSVDAAQQRIFFTSRARSVGSQNTVWALDYTATGAALRWGAAIGDADTTPSIRSGVVYVGNNRGEAVAFDAAASVNPAIPKWTYATGDGTVKTLVAAPRNSTRLYFSTSNRVWSLTDGGTSGTLNWSTPAGGAGSIVTPSNVVTNGTEAWVGSGDGNLVKLVGVDGSAPSLVIRSIGNGAVGAPIIDFTNNWIYVGTEGGAVYCVTP